MGPHDLTLIRTRNLRGDCQASGLIAEGNTIIPSGLAESRSAALSESYLIVISLSVSNPRYWAERVVDAISRSDGHLIQESAGV